MQTHTGKILHFCLLLVLVSLFHTPLYAQTAAAAASGSNKEAMPDKRVQHLNPVTDGKGLQTDPASSGLTLSATLIRDIDHNQALLQSETSRIENELVKHKQACNLDRRTKRDLTGTLHEALSSMTHLRQLNQSGKLGKWQARELAQDMYYQSEALDASLDGWKNKLQESGNVDHQTSGQEEGVRQEQGKLIQTLSDISRMLHNTGKEIVRQAQ